MDDERSVRTLEALAKAVSQQCDTTMSPQKLLGYSSLKALGEEYGFGESWCWLILGAVEEELVGTSLLADTYRAIRKGAAPLSQEQVASLLARAASGGILGTDIPEFIDRPVQELVRRLAEYSASNSAEESVTRSGVDLNELVIGIVRDELGLSGKVEPGARLVEDLGAGELDLTNILIAVWKRLAINTPHIEAFPPGATVADLVSLVRFATPKSQEQLDTEEPFRPHHYQFAHKLLPALLYGEDGPEYLYSVFRQGSGDEFLRDTWDEYAERLECEYVQPDGMACHVHKMGEDHQIVAIRFPKPERSPEAYYAVILFADTHEASYYTCELRDNENSVIGSWDRTNGGKTKHGNHGTIPTPELGDFLEAVLKLYAEDDEPEPRPNQASSDVRGEQEGSPPNLRRTEEGESFFQSMAFSYLVDAAEYLSPYRDLLYEDEDEDDDERNNRIDRARREIELGMRHSTKLSPRREDVAKHVALFLHARCCALSGDFSAATRHFTEHFDWVSSSEAQKGFAVLQKDHEEEEIPGDLGQALGPNGLFHVAQYLKRKDTTASGLKVLDYLIVSSDSSISPAQVRECQKEAERWREEQSSGCFVATAVYGTPSAPKVLLLRTFRDCVLLRRHLGRKLVRTYYAVSPRLAQTIASSAVLRALTRFLLVEPLVFVVRCLPFRRVDVPHQLVPDKEKTEHVR
ncbi:MAG: hypothetical protein HOJ57_14790 [Lentisphaerae bacterium]|jgi:hypothetical protein|nr:hypothetical protein [Lentisphaerota bacterium]MBT7061997.1 hypothetical protein [Lentisphaerota bacterium]